ncbi:MAG: hypothetical protein Ct9H300mP25_05580 [Acidobacteriota bacterium]|nr:MAG: hypothetical protein Ct9H300mP25_05580 [Acidobacteriota bacterium]
MGRGHTVVDTTNFTDPLRVLELPVSLWGSAQQLHLEERFTRVDDGTLMYEFTVNDAASFVRPLVVDCR